MSFTDLIPRNQIESLSGRLRGQGKRLVFTNGVFDILHRGHVDYLTRARALGDVLIVGLNSDASVRCLKGPSRPWQPQSDRAFILLGLKAVDFVVIFGEETPARLIRQVRPDVLVKGADYRLDEIVGADYVLGLGGRVERIRLTRNRSSSALMQKLNS
ncbi:MAG: D-glycero-beta-D-manno-heptose 1-phosphate adenylyltransferase [bacterium]